MRSHWAWLLLAVATVFGAMTTIAVTWALHDVGVGSQSQVSWTATSGNSWYVRVWQGYTRDVCNIAFAGATPGVAPSDVEVRSDVAPRLPYQAWRRMVAQSAPSVVGGAFWNLQAYGWPFHCLAGGFLNSGGAAGSIDLGYRQFRLPGARSANLYPVRPIMSGFILDTCLATIPWFVLLLIPGRLRRMLRRRRGHCPHCDYDLTATPNLCPECGWNPRVNPAP